MPDSSDNEDDIEFQRLRDRLDAAYRLAEGRRLRVAAARAERAHALCVAKAAFGPELGLGTGRFREDPEFVSKIHRNLAQSTVELAYARVLYQNSLDEIRAALVKLPISAKDREMP